MMKNKGISILHIAFASILSSGCYHVNEFLYHDSTIQLHEYEMVAKLRNVKGRKTKKENKNIQQLKVKDDIYLPEEPKAIEDKTVSVNVTEEVPVIDVIMELARMSGTDIQVDPTIVGGVNLTLHDKPLRYVFNRLCGLTDIRYKEKYGIVVFERDVPYPKTYVLDFLDISRSSNSSIALNTSGLTTGSSEVENKVTGTGTSSVETSSTDTFWDDVMANVKQIITTTENNHRFYTNKALELQTKTNNTLEQKQSTKNDSTDERSKNKKEEDEKTSTDKNSSTSSSSTDDVIKLNKRAGMITVTAGEKAHRLIEKYFEQLKKKVTAQVLIEMRVFYFNLDKQYEAGIDWNNISFGPFSISAGRATNNTSSISSSATGNTYANITFNKDISAVATLFESFGSTRTLSNPRINAVNNQPALMSFATNQVYFKVTAENNTLSTTTGSITATNINAEPQTMPIGVIMSVLPSIDIDKGIITLNIRPTISKTETSAKDPTRYTVLNEETQKAELISVENEIPIANVRELDTILKLKDGQTAVIGGFTERKQTAQEKGIPVLRALPLIGNLFTYKTDKVSTTETVILVKATIVDYGAKISDYEKDVYESFSDDPRMNEVLD